MTQAVFQLCAEVLPLLHQAIGNKELQKADLWWHRIAVEYLRGLLCKIGHPPLPVQKGEQHRGQKTKIELRRVAAPQCKGMAMGAATHHYK